MLGTGTVHSLQVALVNEYAVIDGNTEKALPAPAPQTLIIFIFSLKRSVTHFSFLFHYKDQSIKGPVCRIYGALFT